MKIFLGARFSFFFFAFPAAPAREKAGRNDTSSRHSSPIIGRRTRRRCQDKRFINYENKNYTSFRQTRQRNTKKKWNKEGEGKQRGKQEKTGREFRIRIKPSTFRRRESGEGAILLAYTTGFCTSFSGVLERVGWWRKVLPALETLEYRWIIFKSLPKKWWTVKLLVNNSKFIFNVNFLNK